MQGRLVSTALGAIGGIIGGALGYFAFLWLIARGWYGLMLPGALLGLGCGLLARHRSIARGIACALAAVGLGLFAEGKAFRFAQDDSFGYMVRHFYEKPLATLIMFAGGVLLAFWLGKDAGFGRRSAPSGEKPAPRGHDPAAG